MVEKLYEKIVQMFVGLIKLIRILFLSIIYKAKTTKRSINNFDSRKKFTWKFIFISDRTFHDKIRWIRCCTEFISLYITCWRVKGIREWSRFPADMAIDLSEFL